MTYPINTSIPASGNNPSVDQPLMQTNFANISGFLGVDHTAPGTTGDGQHNQVTFTLNQAAPSIAGGVAGLYTNLANGFTGNNKSTLFFQNSSGTRRMSNLVQTTNTTTTNASSVLNSGFSTPWGLIFNFGTFQMTNTSLQSTVTFAVPFTTSIFYADCSIVTSNLNAALFVTSTSSTQLTIKSNLGSATIFWIAVGY